MRMTTLLESSPVRLSSAKRVTVLGKKKRRQSEKKSQLPQSLVKKSHPPWKKARPQMVTSVENRPRPFARMLSGSTNNSRPRLKAKKSARPNWLNPRPTTSRSTHRLPTDKTNARIWGFTSELVAVCADAVPVKVNMPSKSTKDERTLRNPILKGIDRRIGISHFLKRRDGFVVHKLSRKHIQS